MLLWLQRLEINFMNQYKTPKTGGATRIKETFEKQRKQKPSKTLLEILKKKQKKQERSDKRVAKSRRSRDAEL